MFFVNFSTSNPPPPNPHCTHRPHLIFDLATATAGCPIFQGQRTMSSHLVVSQFYQTFLILEKTADRICSQWTRSLHQIWIWFPCLLLPETTFKELESFIYCQKVLYNIASNERIQPLAREERQRADAMVFNDLPLWCTPPARSNKPKIMVKWNFKNSIMALARK